MKSRAFIDDVSDEPMRESRKEKKKHKKRKEAAEATPDSDTLVADTPGAF